MKLFHLLETLPTPSLSMFGLGNPNSSIYVFLVVLSWVFWFVLMWFGFGWKSVQWKRGKNAISVQSRGFPPRRRELRLREELHLGECLFT